MAVKYNYELQNYIRKELKPPINILPFGKENLNNISLEKIIKILEINTRVKHSILVETIEVIHCDLDRPENHNIVVSDLFSFECEIYDGTCYIKQNLIQVINCLCIKLYAFVNEQIKKYGDKIPQYLKNAFNKSFYDVTHDAMSNIEMTFLVAGKLYAFYKINKINEELENYNEMFDRNFKSIKNISETLEYYDKIIKIDSSANIQSNKILFPAKSVRITYSKEGKKIIHRKIANNNSNRLDDNDYNMDNLVENKYSDCDD
jgi:hypothetical protein